MNNQEAELQRPPIKELEPGVDYIGVTCVFFCHDGQGNFVLHKRSHNCRDEIGNWDCGSGTMEFGETFESAVRREIKEEYGCDVLNLKFLGANNALRKNGDINTHWVALIFAARVNPEEISIAEPEKMEKLGWFSPDNFPSPSHSMLLEHFEFVRRAGIV